MSASREKKNRQDQVSSGWSDPKTAREAQQRKEEKRTNVLYTVIAVVFVVVAAAAIIWRSNIIQKTATAATIDGEKYNAAEVTFYYQNVYRSFLNNNYYFLSYLGIDMNTPLESQTISSAAASMVGAEEGQSWKDYFTAQALDQMAAVQAALKAADAEGFTYPDSVQTEYASSMESLKAAAVSSNMSVSQYLASNLGGTMTEKVYGDQLMRMLQYSAYSQAYEDSLTYTDAELEDAYSADVNSYDKVAYESVLVNGSAESTTDDEGNTVEPTEEEEAAAKEAAKAAADSIYAAWQAGESLEALAEDNDKASYTNMDAATYASSVLMDWLFDDARKEGDSTVLESGSNYYVVVFHSRFREDYNTVSVRHILLMVDESELDAESETYEADLQARKDETKAEAEELLAQWKSGEATEDSFAALANEKSEDGGSNTSGGLYSQFPKGYMVQEFNDWSFDPARKSGDTGIVYGESTSYKGYHIMYFVDTDLPYWQVQVTSDLKNEAVAQWSETFTQDHTIEQGSGMKYVG
ncbi:peptidylprolyl isomerase [uncultured Dysosmobacter sp.]|uniref:peptidylprolyl isomerase n=1 Tax=uncultured Dysosmobacter sp. TaxID=2591384 RepID=UPI0026322A02|nr:peptidylprolyl isomerase [uncultured Dysosmobacter sp.]